MPRRKANPFKQALLNGLKMWTPEQMVEAISEADYVDNHEYDWSKQIMTQLMNMPVNIPTVQAQVRTPDGRPGRDTLEVGELSDMLGMCEVCGKLRAQIVVSTEEGRAVSVCGDCYPQREQVEEKVEVGEQQQTLLGEEGG